MLFEGHRKKLYCLGSLFYLRHFMKTRVQKIRVNQSRYFLHPIQVFYSSWSHFTNQTNPLQINTNSISSCLATHQCLLINFVSNYIIPIHPLVLFNLKHNPYILVNIFTILLSLDLLLSPATGRQSVKFNYFT